MQYFKSNIGIQTIIALLSALLFIPYLGQVHLLDWDEINFAESAREMIVSGNYLTVQVNFEAFWEKPPLFIWMQVLSMKIFGINEFAARFPNAICGILTLLVLFNIGKALYNKRFGIFWTLAYGGSILPFFYFKSGIIDPWFNLFIFLGIYFLLRYFRAAHIKFAILAAASIGLSILTKGPVGLLIAGLSSLIYLIIIRFRITVKWSHFIAFTLTTAFVGGFWFILQILNGNYSIIVDFIEYQIHLFSKEGAGHGGFLFYHFVVLFFGVFPASIFALKAFSKKYESTLTDQMRLMMVVLFWTVLILFTIVSTKIVHYSSMCYFPLTYLAAYIMYQIHEGKTKPANWVRFTINGLAVLYVISIGIIPFLGKNATHLHEWVQIKDPFAVANLQANVLWSGWEGLTAMLLIGTIILFNVYWRKGKFTKAYSWLYGGTAIFVFFAMIIFTPKIEGYTQHALIEFYKEKSHEDVYLEPLGYKSYAHYFYGKRTPHKTGKPITEKWLLKGKTDKPTWFIVRLPKKERYLKWYPYLKVMDEKNGFVFLYREAQTSK
ncbi:MAG: glycosyltransferase family 39 protein [Salinivirgaceae bacterium]